MSIIGTTFTDSDGRTFEISEKQYPTTPDTLTSVWHDPSVRIVYVATQVYTSFAVGDTEVLSIVDNISDDTFLPSFSLSNELLDVFETWRDNDGNAAFKTFKLVNHSVVPEDVDSNRYAYQFTDDNVTENNKTVYVDGVSDAIFEDLNFNNSTTIRVSMSGWISKPQWGSSEFVKTAADKYLHILTKIPEAKLFIYPSFNWNESTQVFDNVESDPFTLSPGPSAFAYCHTENVHLSAKYNSNIDSYNWHIEGINVPNKSVNGNDTSVSIGGVAPSEHRIQLQVSNDVLPYGMPTHRYTDDIGTTGTLIPYENYTETISYDEDIDDWLEGKGDFTRIHPVSGEIALSVSDATVTVPGDNISYTVFLDSPPESPFVISENNSEFIWNIQKNNEGFTYTTYITTNTYTVSASMAPAGINDIPFFRSSTITSILIANYSLESVDQLSINDFCSNNQSSFQVVTHTVYPAEALMYTSNKYVPINSEVIFENLTVESPNTSEFIWEDRGEDISYATAQDYITSFDTIGQYDIQLNHVYDTTDAVTLTESRDFERVINVVEFEEYNPEIRRVYNAEKLTLPKRLDQCEVPANDFITQFSINECLNKLKENFNFIDNFSKLYDSPPTEYYGWLGVYAYSSYDQDSWHWRVNLPIIDYVYDRPDLATFYPSADWTDINVRQVPNIGDNIHIVAAKTSISIMASDFRASNISYTDEASIGDKHVNIVALATDNNFGYESRIYVLDKDKNRIVVYEYDFSINEWETLYVFGGYGGATAKYKFNSPSDLIIDNLNTLWITDTNNSVVKNYSRTSSWIQTIDSEYFTDNKPKSVFIGQNNDIHVLCENNIVMFDSNAKFIKTYFPHNNEYNRVRPCKDVGFIYVISSNKVVKLIEGQTVIGEIGEALDVSYSSLYHDNYRNLYLTTTNTAIVKYIDKLSTLNLRIESSDLIWPDASIQINSEEYIQDWVVNKCFARLYDNIEVYRRSLKGRFTNVIKNNVTYPAIRSFSEEEFKMLPYNKEDIFIGINEIVSAPVFNRCIKMIYECLEVILSLVDD